MKNPPPRVFWFLSLALAVWLAPTALAEDPWQVLRGMYPGVREHHVDGRRAYVYGTDMTPGLTPEAAAAEFISAHGRVFGVGELDVQELWRETLKDGELTVFGFEQRIRGIRVHDSVFRIAVRARPVPHVIYAAGRVSPEPLIGTHTPIIPAELALAIVQAQGAHANLQPFAEPELVALLGTRNRSSAWVWRVRVKEGESDHRRPRSFFVDTATGNVVLVRAESFSAGPPSTTGVVEGDGTDPTELLPFMPTTSVLSPQRLPGVRINAWVPVTSTHVFASDTGDFSVALGDEEDPIAIDAQLGPTTVGQTGTTGGHWFVLFDYAGTGAAMAGQPLQDAQTGTVGDDLPLLLSSAATDQEHQVAQVDAIVATHRARAFARQYISSGIHPDNSRLYIGVSQEIGLDPGPCNAVTHLPVGAWIGVHVYSESDTSHGFGCFNMASHSVVAHEYGHIAHIYLGFEDQDSFTEGYADSFAGMLNDDPVQGRHAYRDGQNIRDDPTSNSINCQYPLEHNQAPPHCICDSGKPHLGGQVLSGVWTRIREEFKAEFGVSSGLHKSRSLFGQWSLVTIGGEPPCESAHPGTVLEVIFDISGDPLPSPELDIVCDAFAAHGITCP